MMSVFTLAIVVLLAATPTVAGAFLGASSTPFVGGSRIIRHSPSTTTRMTPFMISWAPIKKLFKRGKKKKKELDRRITETAQELGITKSAQDLVNKADKALEDLENHLIESMKQTGEAATQEIAVEVVKLLNGHWDVAIATDKNETKKMMDGAIDDVAQDVVDFGMAEKKDNVKEELKTYRLRWTTSWDASSYPLRIENSIYVANSLAIQFFGQFQFDIMEKKAVFALDELIVFGVQVDLVSVIEEAKAEATTVDADETDDSETDTES